MSAQSDAKSYDGAPIVAAILDLDGWLRPPRDRFVPLEKPGRERVNGRLATTDSLGVAGRRAMSPLQMRRSVTYRGIR